MANGTCLHTGLVGRSELDSAEETHQRHRPQRKGRHTHMGHPRGMPIPALTVH